MKFIAWAIAAVILLGMIGGAFVYVVNIGEKKCELAQAQKDAQIAGMQRQWAASEQTRLDVETAARARESVTFRAGLAAGRKLQQQTESQARIDAETEPVFKKRDANGALVCVLSPDSLRNILAAFAGPSGVRAAADNGPGTARSDNVQSAG